MIEPLSEEQLSGKHSEEAEHWRARYEDLKKKLGAYRRDHGSIIAIKNEIIENITPIDPPPILYKKSEDIKPVSSPCAAVGRVSDTHTGARQEADEIEGFGVYNSDICERRQIAYANDLNEWVNVHRKMYNLPDLHVFVTGDLVSGDILHDELAITNEFPVPVQAVQAAVILSKQISIWSPNFKKIIVEFITEDNHGRLVKKPQAKEAGLNNMNYIIGHLTKAYIDRFNNVEFNIYPMLEKIVSVLGINYLLTHGHQIKAWMGIPWYGIQRQVGKEATSRMVKMLDELREEHEMNVKRAREWGFHKYTFGHYHTWFEHDIYSCCPSVSGTDAYDHQAGRHSDPAQSAWLIHSKKEKGEFNWMKFRLGHIV